MDSERLERQSNNSERTQPLVEVSHEAVAQRELDTFFERTGFLPVLNRCLHTCRLCSALGCLSDDERSLTSVASLLTQFSQTGLASVTVPPNALFYPHRDQLLELALARRLIPIWRVHPSLGVTSHAPMLADWFHQGGVIEAVVDACWDKADWDLLLTLAVTAPGRVRALLIPTRDTRLLDLVDSIPEVFRKTAEVYCPLPLSPDSPFLICDEIHEQIREVRSLRPQFQIRPARGLELPRGEWPSWLPYEFEPELKLKSSSLRPQPQISVVIATLNRKEALINTLRHLQRQDLEPDRFEVVIVDDGSDDGTLDRIREHLVRSPMRFNLKFFSMPRTHRRQKGDALLRTGQARNIGVNQSSGKTVVFLGPDILTPPHFLNDVFLQHTQADVLQYRRIEIPFRKSSQRPRYQQLDIQRDGLRPEKDSLESLRFERDGPAPSFSWRYSSASCLVVRREHFLTCGGFARAFRTYGLEDVFLGWQLSRMGLKWQICEGPLFRLRPSEDIAEHGTSPSRKKTALAPSAQTFYHLSLDEEFYQTFFSSLGNQVRARSRLHQLSRFRVGRALLRTLSDLINAIGEARVPSPYRRHS